MTKGRLRKLLKAKRGSLTARQRSAKSRAIARALFALEPVKKARTIFFFASFGSEVHTRGMILRALKQGKTVALPVADMKRKNLEFRKISSLKNLKTSTYGVPEPVNSKKAINIKKADVIIVPGLGFDRRGYRIGYGGGFYDRLLKKTVKTTVKIGIAFDCQIMRALPKEKHDEKIDIIITETKIICVKGTGEELVLGDVIASE